MTGLLLATLLNLTHGGSPAVATLDRSSAPPLSPGIQLADNTEARHVALSDVRFRPILVADEAPAVAPAPTLDQMTREQLANELRRLDDLRPGLGGPIALLAVGVALIIPGIVMTSIGIIALIASRTAGGSMIVAFTTASAIVLGIGVVMGTVGIILAIVGGVTLGVRIKMRSENGRAADEVRRRMEGVDNGIPPPQPVPAPAAAPAAPPQANLVVPAQMQTVFTF